MNQKHRSWLDGNIHWIACAFLMTAANVLKPVHVDDIIWVHFARHIAQAPFEPFDFTMPWGYGCIPAMDMWSPPVLPYWWGAAVALFGETPALWKVWFLPFSLIFSWAAFALTHRFAPLWATPVGYAIGLSPTVLPAINLMQDIPAAALVLAAVATVLTACDRKSLPQLVLGGAILGFACLTKWSALSGFGVVGLACLIFAPSWRWSVIACMTGLAIFIGWEGYLLTHYGQSNFLLSVNSHSAPDTSRIKELTVALMTTVGVLAPFVAIAGLSSLKRSRTPAMMVAGSVIATFLALGMLPETLMIENPLTGRGLRPDTPLLAALGLLVWLGLAASLVPALRKARHLLRWDNSILFLIMWLVVELAGYFVLSPFPAARRLITPLVVMTILVAAAAGPRLTPWSVNVAVSVQIAIAVLFALVDFTDARRIKQAAEWSVTRANQRAPENTIWFKGDFGFNYYAARAGARWLCATDILRPGDMLVFHNINNGSVGLNNPMIEAFEKNGALLRQDTLSQTPQLPLTTIASGYYLGRRPIEGSHGPLQTAVVFEVTQPIPWSTAAQ